MNSFQELTNQLAARVESAGLTGAEAFLPPVVAAAMSNGVNPLLIAVLTDPGQPEVARVRALGRIIAALADPEDAAVPAQRSDLPIAV